MSKTRLLLELNVLAAFALFVFWQGWPGWGMVIFWSAFYLPARLLAHRMAPSYVRSRHDSRGQHGQAHRPSG